MCNQRRRRSFLVPSVGDMAIWQNARISEWPPVMLRESLRIEKAVRKIRQFLNTSGLTLAPRCAGGQCWPTSVPPKYVISCPSPNSWHLLFLPDPPYTPHGFNGATGSRHHIIYRTIRTQQRRARHCKHVSAHKTLKSSSPHPRTPPFASGPKKAQPWGQIL